MNFTNATDTQIQISLRQAIFWMLISDPETRVNGCNLLFWSLPEDVRKALAGASLMLLAVERDRVKTLILMVVYRGKAVLTHAPQYQRLHVLRAAAMHLFNVREVSLYGDDNALQTSFVDGRWSERPLELPSDWPERRAR